MESLFYAHGHPSEICQQKLTMLGARKKRIPYSTAHRYQRALNLIVYYVYK